MKEDLPMFENVSIVMSWSFLEPRYLSIENSLLLPWLGTLSSFEPSPTGLFASLIGLFCLEAKVQIKTDISFQILNKVVNKLMYQ